MNDRSSAPRKQTPRVPSNFLYTRLVPVAIGVMGVLLLIILVLGIAGLLNALK